MRQKRTRNTSILSPWGTERRDEVFPWKTEHITFSSRDEIWKFGGCITSAEGANVSGEQNTHRTRIVMCSLYVQPGADQAERLEGSVVMTGLVWVQWTSESRYANGTRSRKQLFSASGDHRLSVPQQCSHRKVSGTESMSCGLVISYCVLIRN